MISCPSRVRISFLVTISRQAADTWGQFFLAGSPWVFWITASPSLTNRAWLVRGELWSKSPFELVPRYHQVPTWNQPLPVWDPPKPWFGSGSADFWLPFGLIYCSVDVILCIFYMLMFCLTWHFFFFRTQNLRKPKCEQSPKHEILSLTVWTVRYILENLGSENVQSLRLSRRGLLIPGGTPKWKELLRNKLNKLVKSPSQLSNIFLEAEKTLTETTKVSPKMAPQLELAESCKVRCWCFTGWLAPWRPSVLGGFSIFSQLAMVDDRNMTG